MTIFIIIRQLQINIIIVILSDNYSKKIFTKLIKQEYIMCKQSFRIYERMIRLMENEIKQPGLYRSELEHDACGIGAIVSINGIKTHQTVSDALSIVENLEHRAGKDAEGKTGDGVGILLQISHKFFKKAVKPLGIELGDERDEADGPQAEGKKRRDQNPAADVDIVLFLRFSAALVEAE